MALRDLEQVIQLDQVSFSLPWPESSFKFEITKNEASRCWVAEIGNKIIGMIVTWLIVDEVHIATFAVDPDYRRQGIAQRLLAHTLIDAARSGGSKAFLEVRKGNLAAQALYRKFGFEEIGTRKKYYQDNGEDAVMMNLERFEINLFESFL
jgi:[ribosomal protein S18]-alanine N-acetyltransferase